MTRAVRKTLPAWSHCLAHFHCLCHGTCSKRCPIIEEPEAVAAMRERVSALSLFKLIVTNMLAIFSVTLWYILSILLHQTIASPGDGPGNPLAAPALLEQQFDCSSFAKASLTPALSDATLALVLQCLCNTLPYLEIFWVMCTRCWARTPAGHQGRPAAGRREQPGTHCVQASRL